MRILVSLILLLATFTLRAEEASPSPMKLALSAVFLGERADLVARWKIYLEAHLQRPVEFIQRRSYRELDVLFAQSKLDAGWVCGAPLVMHRNSQRLLAVGVWQGKPLYQSYLIVPAADQHTQSLADLRGKIFAYSDPESNSGYWVAQGELHDLNADPKQFFAKTLFTYAHNKSVEAVANGLVDGARVDGYIYDMLRVQQPTLVAKTRIVKRSQDFGFPPIVVRRNLPQAQFELLQKTLLNMHQDEEGQALLQAMGLDAFVAGDEQLYAGVASLLKKVKAEAR